MDPKTLKVERVKAGLTQRELAAKLGIGQSAVSMWEQGERVPPSAKLPALAEALNCSIDDLFQNMSDDNSNAAAG